jgi:hypothetical protein
VVVLPCRIQDPDRKGKVESGIGHTQKTPLKGMRFASLEEAQAYWIAGKSAGPTPAFMAQPRAARAHPESNDPLGLAVADLNGDGKLDIVVADFNSLGTPFGGGVSVLLGNGDGTFQAAVLYNTGENPTAVAIGDFNGDAIPDLAVTDNKSGTVSILLGKGDGTFNLAGQFAAGGNPYGIALSDVNRDGNYDIIVTNYCELNGWQPVCVSDVFPLDTVSVLLGNGDGSFQTATAYSAEIGPFLIAVADLNGDGWPDVTVTANGGVDVLLNKGDGSRLRLHSWSNSSTCF